MKDLVKLIGKAPSELSFANFLIRLKEERQRVRNNLLWFKEQGKQVKPRKKAKVKKKLSNKLFLEKNKKILELLNSNSELLS